MLLKLVFQLACVVGADEYYQSERHIRELPTMSRVNTVSWSPDGERIAGAALMEDRIKEVLILWNTSNLSSLIQIPIPDARPWSVAWHPSGDLIATGGRQGEINLVNMKKKLQITSFLTIHKERVNDIEWVSDGSLFVSVSYDGTIGVWSSTRLVRRMVHSAAAIQDVDCKNFLCLTSSKDSTIKLWNVSSGECLRVYEGHEAMVNTVAWSHQPEEENPRFASVSDDGTCRIWNIDGTVDNTLGVETIMQSVDWCSDDRIAMASLHGDIQIWLPWSPVPLYRYYSARSTISYSIRWNSACTRLAVGDPASMLLFDGTKGPLEDMHGEWTKLFAAADWSDKEDITVVMYDDGMVQVRDSHNWDVSQTPPLLLGCQIPWSLLRISPDSTLLVHATCNLTVIQLWSIEGNYSKCMLQHNDSVRSIDWPMEEWFAVGTAAGDVVIWNSTDCTVVSVSHVHSHSVDAIICRLTVDSCVSASEDGRIMLSGAEPAGVNRSIALVKALAWMGRILAIGHAEGVDLWHSDGRLQRLNFTTGVSTLDWDPSSGLLALGTSTGGVYVWNPKLNQSKALTGQLSDILALKWQHDGSMLVAAGREGYITWWNRSMFDIWWVENTTLKFTTPIVGFPFHLEVWGQNMKPGWGQLQTVDTGPPVWLVITTTGNSTHLTANLTGFKHRVYQLRIYCEEASPPWDLIRDFIPRCPDFSTPVDGECECLPTYYAVDEDVSRCLPCPNTAKCSSLDSTLANLKADDGFWRGSSAQLPPFQRCPGSACIAGECVLGYEGILCGTCSHGYAQARFNDCGKCPPLWQNMLLVLLHISVIGAVVAIQSWLALRAPKRNVWGQFASILVSSAQVNAMILNLDMKLPSSVEAIIRAQGSSQGAPNSLYSMSCAAVQMGWPPNSVFYMKLHGTAILPLLGYLLVRIIQRIGACNYCKRAKCWSGHRAYWLSNRVRFVTVVVILYTIYPSLCAQVFQMWSCRHVDTGFAEDGHQYRMSSDLSVTCYNTRYWVEFTFISIPIIVIYVVAAPLFATWRLSMDHGVVLLGFLSRPFTHHWWFLVVLARKLALAAISCFLWAYTPLQLFLCTSCLLFALILQIHHRPFTESAANSAEAISLTMSCLTYSCAILVYFVPFVPFDSSYAGSILMAFPVGYLGILALVVLECRAARRGTLSASLTDPAVKDGYILLGGREMSEVDKQSFPDSEQLAAADDEDDDDIVERKVDDDIAEENEQQFDR